MPCRTARSSSTAHLLHSYLCIILLLAASHSVTSSQCHVDSQLNYLQSYYTDSEQNQQCSASSIQSSTSEQDVSSDADFRGERRTAHEESIDEAANYIVRFDSYKLAEEHRSTLHSAFEGATRTWHWVERQNAAYKLPTDFGLIRVRPADLEAAKERILSLDGVKDIHVDMRITRTTLASESDTFQVTKRSGRFSTKFPEELDTPEHFAAGTSRARRQLKANEMVTNVLKANELHQQGFTGKGVKVGVFDTGIRENHEHIRNIKDRTNWTHQKSLSDGLGHGTFVAGVIASQDTTGCPGFAPDVELFTLKVFTDDQVSYTSWFMDAFNYVIYKKVHIVNLSIGGPDFMDAPFVDKVLEVTSNGIIMVSAIGNDGPLYGTLNNPADQNDVIGVGGIDYYNEMASFSSRGMSTWELPLGYGRVKPDVVAYGRDVSGSRMQGGCRTLSGTSVASPVVAGVVCLLASTVPEDKRWKVLNPASMKQAMIEGADRLDKIHLYEQGAGKINLLKSQEVLRNYEVRASIVPSRLFLDDCPYMWPFCKQPLYASAMPLVFNATILNALGVSGKLDAPPKFTALNENGKLLRFQFEYSKVLWPWSGYLAAYIWVSEDGAGTDGVAEGQVEFTVVSEPGLGETEMRRSSVVWPIRAKIIPTPPRKKRVLWDQFHSIKYPPMYLPRDNLEIKSDILDWHGDHPHTNYHDMYNKLRHAGYFLEVLSSPMTCFNATHYGALLLVDPEEEYYKEEIEKMRKDVEEEGLALLVFGEWYSVASMMKMHFFDDNTRSWWTPVTGGANVPALNDLLKPFGIAFGDSILQGQVDIGGNRVSLASGANILKFPATGHLYTSEEVTDVASDKANKKSGKGDTSEYAVFGVTPFGKGHVSVLGDSNCLDSSHSFSPCLDFLVKLLKHTVSRENVGLATDDAAQEEEYVLENAQLPQRRTDINYTYVSHVLRHPLRCYRNSPCTFHSPADACKTGLFPDEPSAIKLPDTTATPASGIVTDPATPSSPANNSTPGNSSSATVPQAVAATSPASTANAGITKTGTNAVSNPRPTTGTTPTAQTTAAPGPKPGSTTPNAADAPPVWIDLNPPAVQPTSAGASPAQSLPSPATSNQWTEQPAGETASALPGASSASSRTSPGSHATASPAGGTTTEGTGSGNASGGNTAAASAGQGPGSGDVSGGNTAAATAGQGAGSGDVSGGSAAGADTGASGQVASPAVQTAGSTTAATPASTSTGTADSSNAANGTEPLQGRIGDTTAVVTEEKEDEEEEEDGRRDGGASKDGREERKGEGEESRNGGEESSHEGEESKQGVEVAPEEEDGKNMSTVTNGLSQALGLGVTNESVSGWKLEDVQALLTKLSAQGSMSSQEKESRMWTMAMQYTVQIGQFVVIVGVVVVVLLWRWQVRKRPPVNRTGWTPGPSQV